MARSAATSGVRGPAQPFFVTIPRQWPSRRAAPCRRVDSSERLGRHRWVVEQSLAWLLGFRRLGTRYGRRADLLQRLLDLACALVCLTFLAPDAGTVVGGTSGG